MFKMIRSEEWKFKIIDYNGGSIESVVATYVSILKKGT